MYYLAADVSLANFCDPHLHLELLYLYSLLASTNAFICFFVGTTVTIIVVVITLAAIVTAITIVGLGMACVLYKKHVVVHSK